MTVVELDKRPVAISVSWARIEGHLVMFWYACSQVTDSVQIDAWLAAMFDVSVTWLLGWEDDDNGNEQAA